MNCLIHCDFNHIQRDKNLKFEDIIYHNGDGNSKVLEYYSIWLMVFPKILISENFS